MTCKTIISAIAALVAIALPAAASARPTPDTNTEFDCLISETNPRAHYDDRVNPMTFKASKKIEPPRLQRIRVVLGYGVGYVEYKWEAGNVVVPFAVSAYDGGSGGNFLPDAVHHVHLQWQWNGAFYSVSAITINVDYPDGTKVREFGLCVPRMKP